MLTDKEKVDRTDFYCLGKPLLDPPTVRGSIVIDLNIQFLLENEKSFIYGSVSDIGGVRFGFEKIRNPKLFERYAKCNFKTFKEILDALDKNSLLETVLESRRFGSKAIDLLSKYLDESVLQVLRATTSPHMCIFEFKLSHGYVLKPEHVVCVNVPNTYLHYYPISRLRQKQITVVPYNPKYGIERCVH